MQENNKRIAKNTLFLYFRMLLTMGVGLYASRVVLNTLGIEDYGIYNIIGGMVIMLSFLNSSMTGATSRFLTFELGRSDFVKLKNIFSAAITVHFIIAVIILVLAETVGLWWLENKLVIPIERITATRWIYQFSIISAIIGIMQIPYNALIISHERMDVYAYIEILNSLLKLGIIYLLIICNFDKLILYAILTLCVTIIITTIYRIFCKKNFAESHYQFIWNKGIIQPMMVFSGWSLYQNSTYTLKTQGVNILLNMFFGVALNASYGIAAQVQNAILGFSSNFLTAARPQIVKYYASGEIVKMKELTINVSKFSYLLMLLFSFPILIEGHIILNLWLHKIPDYAVNFIQFNIIYSIIWTQNNSFGHTILATGKIKKNCIINGTNNLLVLPLSYICFINSASPIIPFVINVIFLFISFISNLIILCSIVKDFSFLSLLFEIVFKNIIIFVIIFGILHCFTIFLKEGLLRLFLVIVINIILVLICGYFILLNKKERIYLRQIAGKKIESMLMKK